MINSELLTDDLAEEVAEEVICTCCAEHVEGHIADKIVDVTIKELLDNIMPSVDEIKRFALFEKLFKSLKPYEKQYKTMLATVWEKERKIVISNIKKMKKAWLIKDKIDDLLYPVAQFEKELSENALKIDVAIIDAQGNATMIAIAGTDVLFDVTSSGVQNWLKTYMPKFSAALEEVSVAKLRRELIEGMTAGEGIPQLINRVNLTYANWNKVRSESIARSEALRASNRASLEAYKQSGVVKKKIWITHFSAATCVFCRRLNGKTISIDKPFFPKGGSFSVGTTGKRQTIKLDYETVESPPLHPRCLLPETECISPGGFISGLRVKYIGKAIKFIFSDGSELSVTPNHLLLTPYGFATANLLCRGDNVIYCPDFERIVSCDPNNDRQPTSVEDIISSLSKISGMFSSSVPVSPKYLHNDGRFCNGNIDIISPNCFLRDAVKSLLSQGVNTDNFNSTYSHPTVFSSLGSFTEQFKRLAFATDSIMGGSRQSSSFFRARSSHPDIHRGTAISGDNIIFKQSPTDHGSCNFESFRKSLFRLSSIIKTKKIVDIKIFSFHGDVYDFQTPTSLYIANSIITSNCRCTVSPWIKA